MLPGGVRGHWACQRHRGHDPIEALEDRRLVKTSVPRDRAPWRKPLSRARLAVTLLPVTGEIRGAPLFRVTVEPSEANGVKKVPQVIVDNPVSARHERIGKPFGNLEDETLLRVNRALAVWIGLA